MNENRAPRVWHIEERYGFFYATCQFGGFSRYGTREQAVEAIERDIARYGDRWTA
jgi:hypothetical protein